MPSQPPPGSIGGTPPSAPVPSQPAPYSTGGSARTPAVLSGQSPACVTPRSVTLDDWCLEKVEGEEGKVRVVGTARTPQMRKGASSSMGNRNMARRVFRSSPIVKRHDNFTIESEDGYLVRICSLLDKTKTRDNGLSQEVCECFESGFPIQWHGLVNPKMVPDDETTASTPAEYHMKKFLSDDFSNSVRHDFTENDSYSSVGYAGSIGGLFSPEAFELTDDNAGNINASWGLYGLRMDMPEKPLAAPEGACNNTQESDLHESMQLHACKHDLVNRFISSVSVKQSTGSISPNSKVDVNILTPSKIMSAVNESYRSAVGCGQAEEDSDILQENMHSCSTEHGMVPTIDCTSSQLGEPGIPKCRRDSMNIGTTDALELPTVGMTPKFGTIGGSEHSTDRRLRSGKVLGMPNGGSMKRGHKQEKIQQLASSKQKVNQGASSTMDLTSHENVHACKHDLVNRFISSVSVKQSTGSISPNSKVDVNILTPSKIMSAVNEIYRSAVGCGQAVEDSDILQENMHSCSTEHGMVPTIDCTSSQLGEPGIPKCRRDSMNIGTTDALELPTEGMTPKFGAIGGSEHSTDRRLRSGKVLGMPNGGSMKRGHKQEKIQQLASSKQKVNQGASSTMDLTSHENDFSAAEIVIEEKLESHDSCPRERGRPGKRKRRK